VCPDVLVLLERKPDQFGARRVAAFAEERRRSIDVQFLPLYAEFLVRRAEENLVARRPLLGLRLLLAARHCKGISRNAHEETLATHSRSRYRLDAMLLLG